MGDELGQGAFSVVRLATNRETGKQFAVKIIKKDGLPHEDEVALHEEVNILKSLNHENIIRLYDFFDEAKFYYLVTELMDGGELFDRIVKKTYYNEKEARDLIRILLFAIKHLHDQDIVHRDLKPENLLLASQKDDADIKLADFGFAARVEGYNSLKTQCGTPGYVAPEILKNETYGKAVDMWSIGVITYILLGGYPPFHDENQAMLFRKIKNAQYQFHPDYWDPVSSEAKDLITRLLKPNPLERLTVDEALSHEWLSLDDGTLESRNLGGAMEELRRFNAKRKFRAAVRALIVANRFNKFLETLKGMSAEEHKG
jgi:serine/threonine protein kinase